MIVDLRSDTVTKPTPEMYRAMAEAELGDDVLGDEPTVRKLEELAAEKLGFEACLFVPSGTMGNQVALATHAQAGDAAVFDDQAHMLHYEGGAPATIARVLTWTLATERGTYDLDRLDATITERNLHTPGTVLVCVENTHNRHGGSITPPSKLARIRKIADRHQARVHMDGARVYNAAVALGVDVREITNHVDTASVCLSKGLRAPVGSVLGGSEAFIEQANLWRKRLGGGMRQSGILAACGIVALERYIEGLAEDHNKAKRLAEALANTDGFEIDPRDVETNIVIAQTDAPAAEWADRLEAEGVRCFPFGPHRLRFVTHADVSDEAIESGIETLTKLARS